MILEFRTVESRTNNFLQIKSSYLLDFWRFWHFLGFLTLFWPKFQIREPDCLFDTVFFETCLRISPKTSRKSVKSRLRIFENTKSAHVAHHFTFWLAQIFLGFYKKECKKCVISEVYSEFWWFFLLVFCKIL